MYDNDALEFIMVPLRLYKSPILKDISFVFGKAGCFLLGMEKEALGGRQKPRPGKSGGYTKKPSL